MILNAIGSQFKKPKGILGRYVSDIMVKRNWERYEELIKLMNIQQNEKILEIGYGPGLGVFNIARRNESCRIDGIDFSKLMHKKATKLNNSFIKKDRVKLMYGDFLNVKIKENYDKVFCVNVVYFWDDLSIPFKKIKELIKKGGTLYFYMNHKNGLDQIKITVDKIFNKYSIEEIENSLKDAGFKDINYIENSGYYISAK